MGYFIFSASHDSLDVFPFEQRTKHPVFLGYLLPAIYRSFMGWEVFLMAILCGWRSGLFVTCNFSFIYGMGYFIFSAFWWLYCAGGVVSRPHDSMDMFPLVQQTKNLVFLGHLLPAIFRSFMGWDIFSFT